MKVTILVLSPVLVLLAVHGSTCLHCLRTVQPVCHLPASPMTSSGFLSTLCCLPCPHFMLLLTAEPELFHRWTLFHHIQSSQVCLFDSNTCFFGQQPQQQGWHIIGTGEKVVFAKGLPSPKFPCRWPSSHPSCTLALYCPHAQKLPPVCLQAQGFTSCRALLFSFIPPLPLNAFFFLAYQHQEGLKELSPYCFLWLQSQPLQHLSPC